MRIPPFVRGVASVAAGFVIIAVLALGTDAIIRSNAPELYSVTGRMDSWPWLVATLAYVFIYATFGCWLTGRLAPNRPMRHAMILGGRGLLFNIAGTATQWATAPAWYHVLALSLVLPAAWLGGYIRERQLATAVPAPFAAP